MRRMYRVYLILSVIMCSIFVVPSVYAAKPNDRGGSGSSGGGANNSATLGIDISWPQCGKRLPSDPAFAIIGVNGGKATTTNPCLTDQLVYAAKISEGRTTQPSVQLYVNTANPYGYPDISTWPQNNIDPGDNVAPNPYQECTGDDSLACAWQYGWNRAVEDVIVRFIPAANAAGVSAVPGDYTWWLDVETDNSWRDYAYGYDMTKLTDHDRQSNTAVLEGMTAYFQYREAEVGVYSTGYQWGLITGIYASNQSSLLNTLDNWLAGAASETDARSKCFAEPLTSGGQVVLTQFVKKNLDYDYSCI